MEICENPLEMLKSGVFATELALRQARSARKLG